MALAAADRARIHNDLVAERQERLDTWDAAAPRLDLTDAASRNRWVAARQKLFEDVGPIHPDAAARSKLSALKDRYRGERIFVIGNGPSLNRTALHLLDGEFTFGVNRIYLMFERISWRPTFYTTLDWRVAPDCADEINALSGIELFFPERFRGLLRDGEDVTWYANDGARHRDEQGFASDASLGIRGAGSVTGAAIQLAFHMGFDPIYLIGCDVSYSVADTVVQEGPDRFNNGVGLYLTSTKDDDENHFDKRYFGTGKRWHDPNVKRMVEGFVQCRDGADRHSVTLRNATEGGQLEVFDRSPFRSLFNRGDLPAPTPSLAGFIVASLAGGTNRLMVDVGAGRGSHFAPFASLGWEIRALEPSCEQRHLLRRAVPTDWNVFIDPRALDAKTGPVDTYLDAQVDGLSLAPPSKASEPGGRVNGATPEYALEPMGERSPDVLAIDSNNWELEIFNAWPFESTKPEWIILGIEDSVSARFTFSRRTAGEALRSGGYEVIAVEGGHAFVPDEDWMTADEWSAFVLIGAPSGTGSPTKVLHDLVNTYQAMLSRDSDSAACADVTVP